MGTGVLILFVGVVLCTQLSISAGIAVMSIDLGSEFLKIAIVKPGVPMEIVLNKESQRKTSNIMTLYRGERLFASPALTKAVRVPESTFWYLSSLVGSTVDSPECKAFLKRFPYFNLVTDDQSGSIAFKLEDGSLFTIEETMAQILEYARDAAEAFAEQPIKDAVITIPPFYTQAQRRAVLRAADMIDLGVLELMNDNAAVALNYGVFRRKAFNTTPQFYMFFDMGATSTVATVVSYQVVKTKEHGRLEEHPQLSVKGVGFDRTLGGLDFQLRLRDHLAKVFNEQKKTKNDVTKNSRAMNKLLKEAGRVKHVLSANVEHYAQVESLLDDIDFRAKITREQFEELCSDLFERVPKVVADALLSSSVPTEELQEVILMGGGTRVPKVQEKLKDTLGKSELGRSINTDEAAAMGAVYQAAHLSKGFKVKLFQVKDAVIFPIQVEFAKYVDARSDDSPSKTIRRTLFAHMNAYPMKKLMIFSKHANDFGFNVTYGDMTFLTDKQLHGLSSTLIQQVSLVGVADALSKHSENGSVSQGIKAHFRLDESGVLNVDSAEAVFEKTIDTSSGSADEESTLSKLGSKISNFFGGGGSSETETPPSGESETKNNTESAANQTTEQPVPDKNKTLNETKNTTGSLKNETDSAQKKPAKPRIVREPITVNVDVKDTISPSVDSIAASRQKLTELRKADEQRHAREHARNELESFIFETQDKLSQDIYIDCSTSAERDFISSTLSQASDWFYEQEDSTDAQVFRDKLLELRKTVADLFDRVKEKQERPKAIDDLTQMLNYSEFFLLGVINMTQHAPDLYTKVEVETLQKLINSTYQWMNEMTAVQNKKPDYEKPVLTVRDVTDKLAALSREILYLTNKAKSYRPKPTPKSENKTTKANQTFTASNDTDSAENITLTQQSEPTTTAENAENTGSKTTSAPSEESSSDPPNDSPQIDLPITPPPTESEPVVTSESGEKEHEGDAHKPADEL